MKNYITFIPEEKIEPSALQQIKNTASLSLIFHHDKLRQIINVKGD